ncbi:hypothetical protein ACFVUS_26435 [Nocardia sp. NPDC058058]|uniref:hypothetical protein n=1 Tax=Nocardia sp. NPDC058058 TaxID=3346317 RepID=UPI0036D863FB
MLSGIVLVGLAFAASGLALVRRVLNGLIGVGFIGYAIYLGAVFEGGQYTVFWGVFILPVTMLIDSVRTMDEITDDAARRRAAIRAQGRERAATPHRTSGTRERMAARKAAELDAIRAKRAGAAEQGETIG